MSLNSDNTSGHVGHLTIDEQRSLQQTWVHILRLYQDEPWATDDINQGGPDAPHGGPKESRLSESDVTDITDELLQLLDSEVRATFRRHFWSFIKTDNPDALVLRFLRARKWDPHNAACMLVGAVNWRARMSVEENVVRQGEAVALREKLSKTDEAFMEQYRSGKSYVRGTDKANRPVYIVRVKLHEPRRQTAETMEAFTLHNIETLRVAAREPDDKSCLIFDLTGFGLRNMDVHLVKFIVEVFEARYPETLGAILVHNAPFVFWGIWTMVKGWLDPVVAGKVEFTRNNGDLAKFIPKERLQTLYGGEDPWTYEYQEPIPGENDAFQKVDDRDRTQSERNDIAAKFDKGTLQWVLMDTATPEAQEATRNRMDLARELYDNYWQLDPFVRTRTYYDRIGAISSDGKVNFGAIGGVPSATPT